LGRFHHSSAADIGGSRRASDIDDKTKMPLLNFAKKPVFYYEPILLYVQ
jgi:hypothetical protein